MSSATKSQISWMVDKIRELHSQHAPLNLTSAKRRFPDLVHAAYAVKPFLGWRKLLIAAGIDYKDIEREYLDYVVCNICGKHFSILTGHLREKNREKNRGQPLTLDIYCLMRSTLLLSVRSLLSLIKNLSFIFATAE